MSDKPLTENELITELMRWRIETLTTNRILNDLTGRIDNLEHALAHARWPDPHAYGKTTKSRTDVQDAIDKAILNLRKDLEGRGAPVSLTD